LKIYNFPLKTEARKRENEKEQLDGLLFCEVNRAVLFETAKQLNAAAPQIPSPTPSSINQRAPVVYEQ
jgi:hypothetical protein